MMTVDGYDVGARIHQSRVHSIHRALRLADGLPVVIKTLNAEYPSRQEVAGLRREHQVTQRLQSVNGVIRAYALESHGNGNIAIILELFGLSLAERLATEPRSSFGLSRFFAIATLLSKTLAQIHEKDIVHKNIEPGSILIDDTGAIRLIDFSISSELALERQESSTSKRLEGNPAYISPEQTGRMNRDLDYRSDYYSLGITLFELLTGELPFRATSGLEWVHCHLGKMPRQPREINSSIPEAVSAIVLKLMAKNAEDRYQSSYGLLEDLGRCERELAQTGTVCSFPLGQRDVSRKLQIPQKLYGREAELAVLLSLFENVVRGSTEFCMVSGNSGVGKSALVNEIGKALVRQNGYIIEGKFDQFQRSTPYSAVAQAFAGFVQQLLGESDQRRKDFCERLLAAIGPNGRLLTDLVPDLESIIGVQPSLAELPGTEAQNRFQIVILNFVRVICTGQPLVIFLDDLQFCDAPTLNMLRWIASARELTHLMIIGAFRSNELDIGHPLRLALDDIRQTRAVHELPLQPLDCSSVEQFVADALRAEGVTCRRLSELLHARTEGNPLFLAEMLKALEQSRAIAFIPEVGRWHIDMDAVLRGGTTGNVVELMLANLRRLPPAAQRVLQLAACIGSAFDLRTLSIIHEKSMDETGEDLLIPLQRHMIIPLQGDYKFVGKPGGSGHDESSAGGLPLNPSYRFHHDRLQQAAYALIDDEHKQAFHLSIGRLIQQHASQQECQERVTDIVGHLNHGRSLIVDVKERKELARLNLAAGIQAQHASAYETALGYLQIGNELLPADSWVSDYKLTMDLATEYQQCAYLTARYEEAESWIDLMLARAVTNLEKAEILSMRTRQYATMGKMEESIRAAIIGLRLLGMRINDNPDSTAIRLERAAVWRNLAGRRIAELIATPPLKDPSKIVAVRLLMEIFAAAFLSGSGNLFPFLVLKSVNISLRYGSSPESAFAYAAYGMLLCGALGNPALGHEFGKLAVAMNERFDDITLKSRVIYVYAMFVHHWSEHWSSMTPWFRKGIESGYQSGDMLYLAYSAQDCIIWDPKLDLETAEQQHAELLKIVRDCGYQDSFDSGTLFLQMQRNFLGVTNGLCSMNSATFEEGPCLEGMRRRKFMTGIANYHIYKAEICFLYGAYSEALSHVREQDQLIASSMSLPQLVRFYIVAFLTLASCYSSMRRSEQVQTRKRMQTDLRRMTRLAAHCPGNFLHLQQLMKAELACLDGSAELALHLYDTAIETAHTNEFRRDEAVANERAARYLLAVGRCKAAEGYLRAAWRLFESWGARRKVARLEEEFPLILGPLAARRASIESDDELHTAAAAALDSASLDMASLMKASQAISSEIVLEQLWTTTMQVMLENAGGQRGCFVIRRDGQLFIEGLSEVGHQSTAPARAIAVDGANGALSLPISIVYHVLHTNTPVVLHDARERAGPYSRDAYLLARKPQSVLCIPLLREGKFEGAIYMENTLTASAFTKDRIEVIKLLAAQVSISIENAQLYQDQQRLIEAQRRFVPSQFLESLHHHDIAGVQPGENVATTMSMMFADLRDFTSLAERLDPRTTIDLLNRYFVSMEPQISQAGGFIDSFSGDEIMALFADSADTSIHAGIGLSRALEEFNKRSAALNQPELTVGIGVNTGPVVLGVVGGRNRIQCSVIGDTVNLASRIEQLTKLYRARFLIGEQTFRSLANPDVFATRLVDRVAVKGKDEPVELYEVIDAEPEERRAGKLASRSLLIMAMKMYEDRKFDDARVAFERISREDPQDAVPGLFADRCARYLRVPPPQDWRGFEKLDYK